MLSKEQLDKLSEIFKVLGDPTRLKIIHVLSQGEANVTAISEKIGMEQSATSHQLRKLKDRNLVKSTRRGRTVNYSLDDDHVMSLFSQGLEHVDHILEEESK